MGKGRNIALFLAFGCCISLNLMGVPVYGSTVSSQVLSGTKLAVEGGIDKERDSIKEGNTIQNEEYSQEGKVREITQERLYGGTRYETGKVIAEYFAQGEVENVIITTGNNYADALSASVLAYELGAPILLVDTTVEKSQDAFSFIRQNLTPHGNVYIIGGKGIISETFEIELQRGGFGNQVRIEGNDRYDTSYKIANTLQEKNITTVVIASGEQYPDALSISSIAANRGWPILLVPPYALPEDMKEYLQVTSPSQILIVGGEGAISQDVISQINGLLPESNIERITGQTRFDTNALIAKNLAPEPNNLFLTTGYNFADALAGSLLAAQSGAPIIFIDPTTATLPKGAANYFEGIYSNDVKPNIVVFGGSGAVPDETLKAATDLLSGRAQGTSIYNLEDLNVEVIQGNKYSLPPTIQGRLYNSEKVNLPVMWNSPIVDTKGIGLQVFEGIVEGYERTIKLNLSVRNPLPISEYTTYFNAQEINRSENIRIAAKAIDGKVLVPGEVFSFNETVGRRTIEAGYKEAMIIEGNVFTPGLGGGICQVSSTLYNVVDLAQLEILERHHHTLRINYVPPGKDAAVYYGVLDFRFKNTSKDSLILRTSVEGNALTMKFFKK